MAASDTDLREQLSKLHEILALATLMTQSDDEERILDLATSSVPSLTDCRQAAVHLSSDGWHVTTGAWSRAATRTALEKQLVALGPNGGPVTVVGEVWSEAFALRTFDDLFGHIVVVADREPPPGTLFRLRVLAHQIGVALANARLLARERASAAAVLRSNVALAETVSVLERRTEAHERLTQAALEGAGPEGIARVLHELTRLPVAVEDAYGNLRAWAGPGRPDPYPKPARARRDALLGQARRESRSVSEGQSVFAAARAGEEILGMLVLFGAGAQAGPTERVMLEYGATALALELSRLRGLAEAELRLGRDLVEELVAGTDEAGALAHAEALGYDLTRPHRVAAVEILRDDRHADHRHADDHAVHAVRRAARDTETGTLLAELSGFVVVLADPASPWETFQSAVVSQLGGVRCRVGVGGRCERPSDFPRSHREALFALTFKDVVGEGDQTVRFDDLGVYRLFAQGGDVERMERFVDIWLSALIAYDERRGSDLLLTLTRFLECGGAHDRTAELLVIHRNTLKYRLRRIREISGRDLNDPDAAFNLQLAVRAWQTVQALRN